MSDNPRTSGRSLLSNYRCTKLRGPGENKVKKKGKVVVGGWKSRAGMRTRFSSSTDSREKNIKKGQTSRLNQSWEGFFFPPPICLQQIGIWINMELEMPPRREKRVAISHLT